MKCKVIGGTTTDELEGKINSWLEAHGGIEICFVNNSETDDGYNIIIFYKEN